MKKIIVTYIIFIYVVLLHAQNLVPNSSFENYVTCPYTSGQINYASGWYSPTSGTPDYYNACSPAMSVPNNIGGWEYAKTGNAYAGILSWDGGFNNEREYIQVQLTDTLIVGKRYYVSFYVSLPDSMQYSCNSMGAYLSQTAISSLNTKVLSYIPQIANSSAYPLTNKIGWTLVTDTFTAVGNEHYITIGNFYNDANSDTSFVGGASFAHYAYYYIDDVQVILYDSLFTGIKEKDNKELFNVSPNPAADKIYIIQIPSCEATITFFNQVGKEIKNRRVIINNASAEIDVSDLREGIYFLYVKTNENIFTKKIIVLRK